MNMQKIIYIKDYEEHKRGEVALVQNNTAHDLIEREIVSLYTELNNRIFGSASRDKMMRAEVIQEKRNNKKSEIKNENEYQTK